LRELRSSCSTLLHQAEVLSAESRVFCRQLLSRCNNPCMSALVSHLIPTVEFALSDKALNTEERESGSVFAPKFDSAGLLTAVVVGHADGQVLVVAHMNAEAIERTLATGKVHFWSRSRGCLWMKGETSGHVLNVEAISVDCDQDALVIRATPAGPTCHTGARCCFYRQLEVRDGKTVLVRVST
jgi:phosphoribosyl-AMP cyclohydrolase